MCGILGWVRSEKSKIGNKVYCNGINRLFKLSETRGKEASGVCCVSDNHIYVLKAPIRAKELIKSAQYKECMDQITLQGKAAVMGHARIVTDGDSSDQNNNQPVIKGDLFCIHNGIIVNSEQLWEELGQCNRSAEVDTEVLLELLTRFDYKKNFSDAFNKAVNLVEGSLSVVLFDRTSDYLALYTNTGSLYYAISPDKSDIMFSSERYA